MENRESASDPLRPLEFSHPAPGKGCYLPVAKGCFLEVQLSPVTMRRVLYERNTPRPLQEKAIPERITRFYQIVYWHFAELAN